MGGYLLFKKFPIIKINFSGHFQAPAAAPGNLDGQVGAFFYRHPPQEHQVRGHGRLRMTFKLVQGNGIVNRGQVVKPQVIPPLGVGNADKVFLTVVPKHSFRHRRQNAVNRMHHRH